MSDAKPDDGLTPCECKFRELRAAGLALMPAYGLAGYDVNARGWRRDANDLERRRVKEREAIERARHWAATEPIRRALCDGLRAIVDADVGAALGDDGQIDAGKLKASGLGRAVRSVTVGPDRRIRSLRLHDKVRAAKLLHQLA